MATLATTKAIRQALIFSLKSAPAVIALVPADRIFPQQVAASPTWPYIHLGATIAAPVRASCMDGRTLTLGIHAYARTAAGQPYGETLADDIADAVAAHLDGLHIPMGDEFMDINWVTNNTIRDPSEASAFHSICQIECSFVG